MRSRAADIRDLALLAVGTVMAAYVIPVLPFVGVPLAAFALALITYRFGDLWGWLVAGATCALMVPLNGLFGFALWAPVLLIAGPLGARVLQKRDAVAVTVVISAVVLCVMIAYFALAAAVAHQSLVAFFETMVNQSLEAARSLGAASTTTASAKVDAAQLYLLMLATMPGALVVTSGATGVLSTVAMTAAARRAGVSANALPKLTTLEISSYALVPLIAGIALLAGGIVTKGVWSNGLTVLGGNLITVAVPLLTLQGVGIALFLMQRFEVPRWGRVLAIAVALLIEWLIPLLTLAGLVDTWLNLRRLPRDGESSPETR